MEHEDQDERVDLSSDQEFNSHSLNNSLSEEEFSIGNFNITNGGLKLTISCRKKSCDDELDKNSNDKLDSSSRTHLKKQRENAHTADGSVAKISPAMDSKSPPHPSDSELPDGPPLEAQTSDFLQVHQTTPKTLYRLENQPQDNPGACASTLQRIPHLVAAASTDFSEKPVQPQCMEVSKQKDNLPSYDLDVRRTVENVKDESKVSLKSHDSNSCSLEVQEPLLRMDALPNVSPESGISSLDESPFGNESPDFVSGHEPAVDQHLAQPSALNCSHAAQLSKVLDNTCRPERPVLHAKPGQPLHKQTHSGNSQEELEGDLMSKGGATQAVQKLPPPLEASVMPVREDPSYVHSSVASHGNGVILSSPHKISQAMGRKKRGRPPKSTKSLLLKHKKSTLYSGSFDSGSSREALMSKSSLPLENSLAERAFNEKTPVLNNGDNIYVMARSPKKVPSSSSDTMSPRYKAPIQKRDGEAKGASKAPRQKAAAVKKTSLAEFGQAAPSLMKRPRGRPRKAPEAPDKQHLSSTTSTNKPRKRKYSKRKLLFTRLKKKRPERMETTRNTQQEKTAEDVEKFTPQESASSAVKLHELDKPSLAKPQECSVFQDNDLDALLLSVKSSIKSQFKEDVSGDVIRFDNPFSVMQPPPFPKVPRPTSPRIVKPKAKRPKLHVMMRQTKRRKKKVTSKPAAVVEPRLAPPPKLDVFCPVAPPETADKFFLPPQKKCGTFGSALSSSKRPFFTSCVQPSKILASSRLNVFRSGTGVYESHRAITPPDIDAATDSFEKRFKKRHKLLYRKSKHKNIVDPVFAADLDNILDGLDGMAISENPTDNFIRVRPGEVPLPSIFRVIKIDVNRKMKDRIFLPEPSVPDKAKVVKSRKDSVSPSEPSSSSFRPVVKPGRKKSGSDAAAFEQHKSQVQGPVSDPCDQRLPPKKRHRMVNPEESQELESLSVFGSEPIAPRESKLHMVKKKGKRSRKISGQDDGKSDSSQVSSRMGQQFVGQELTIDTSQCFLTCTPSLSPCPSRLSTRSSTLPSLSSPSPTGSVGFRSRPLSHHHSGRGVTLTCPLHSSAATGGAAVSDRISCVECQLLEQSSVSPGSLRSGRFSLKSGQPVMAGPGLFSDRQPSSSEPSPNLKLTPLFAFDKSASRAVRKRRKSSNLSGEESDSSPPRLEKNVCISPRTNMDSSFFSEPPNIMTTERYHASPKQTVSVKQPSSSKLSPNTTRTYVLSPKSAAAKRGKLKKQLPTKKQTPVVTSPKKVCNNLGSVAKKTSRSVITMSCPEYEPLPLEHCSNRRLVKEIKAATTLKIDKNDGTDEESGPEQDPLPSPIQPPRKRYQRVGLFSDFYKDAEPRKRCENMVRCRDRLTYVKGEHEFGLLPQPLHIGHFYMRQQQDFQLPYDIWWQHIHQQLPPKKPEPKIKFRNIRTNVYSDSKVNHRKLEIPLCNCKAPLNEGRGCLDDCLNRMIYTECSTSTCPLGENCGNQRIQKHEWAPGLEKIQTKDRGIGVAAKQAIKTGQFILEYLGEVVSETEFRRRMMEEYSEECHHYALHLDSGSLIDGYRMGNIGRYVNHSCQPNCEMQKWNVNGLYRMVLFALRDIKAGEELSYDYNFDPFNQETQQECRCGSSECRGVIGGKRGLNMIKVVEDCKDKRKSKCMNKKIKDKPSESLPVQPMTKPMTLKERCYARKHCTFLVRNVDKVRNQKNPGEGLFVALKEEVNTLDCTKISSLNPELMLASLNERSVKTRLAAYAKDNPELARRHQLAQIFDKMLTELLSLKDEDGTSLVTPLMSLPSRKKQPQYYEIVRNPIDMSVIKQRVKTGFYDHLSMFNADIMLLFSNVELYCGCKSNLGQIILKLRRVFNCVKTDVAIQVDEILGPNTTKSHMDMELARLEQANTKGCEEPEEDIIRCICGVTRDEGLMLMCEKCMRWQHCDCVQASGTEEHYLCDRCEPRYYDPEILLLPPPPDAMPDCTHYMTLLKDDVQYAVGDCVYVMRDCKRTSSGAPLRTSHRLLATCSPDKLDVFRLDQLWKDPKGERFASGTPYLRPQETFHEPTRKFYQNELFRTPSFEIIPMELVMGKCIVMDPNTYSKGRPKGVKEQDVYICEYRVDKTAHLFHKIQKIWYPINTSKFCFDWFDKKLTMKRTFSPHEVPEEYKRKIERNSAAAPAKKEESSKKEDKVDMKPGKSKPGLCHGKLKVDDSIKNDLKLKAEVKVNVKKGGGHKVAAQMVAEGRANLVERIKMKQQERHEERRLRLDKILTKLLNNIPGKQKVDLTYLLEEEKRVRKKITK